ncbi:hypothetical protein R3P38DRAFT_3234652 [Favolaschia claudopus]|uniref:Uncharacterized protein n=1 Tax=Favolaschia claudopus TaxID=2862362 RepID=A0AAV9ZFR0_9AGAR
MKIRLRIPDVYERKVVLRVLRLLQALSMRQVPSKNIRLSLHHLPKQNLSQLPDLLYLKIQISSTMTGTQCGVLECPGPTMNMSWNLTMAGVTPNQPDSDSGHRAETPLPNDNLFDSENHEVFLRHGEVDEQAHDSEYDVNFGVLHEEPDRSEEIVIGNSADWWPWANREEALLDIMTAFPRSVFSERELEATRWFSAKCGIQDLPLIRQVKSHRSKILDLCGADLKSVDGKLGNTFAVLDLGKILADECANPLVRPFIRVLSEDAGEFLAEACQAEKWRTEISPSVKPKNWQSNVESIPSP